MREIRQNFGQTSKRSLPRVNLPSFSGSYESWLGFHELFKSLVDDDKEIPDIGKLYHLKGCLRDEAAEVIASIELSSENYTVAWNLLKLRYDNRKTIRQAHVKALLNLPVLSREFTVRSLLYQVQKHVRELEALKEPVDQWDTLLVEIIKQKLNSFICEKWEDSSCESANPTFKELITFMKRSGQFEDIKPYQNLEKPKKISEKNFLNLRPNQRLQHAFAASATKYPCPHCQGERAIYNCANFKKLAPTERFEAVKKLHFA